MMNGIDVSAWQGEIDFNAVKKSGVDFVIIKAGGSDDGFYKDSRFEQNYENARKADLFVGAYYFVGSKCLTAKDGEADAERFYNIIKGKQFSMPVYMDVETTPPSNKEGATNAAYAFCRYMESKKYWCGIYGSEISTFEDRLQKHRLEAFTWWIANYSDEPGNCGIWQKSSSGKVAGIVGNVDIDVCFVNFPAQIISSGYNGYSEPIKEDTKTPLEKNVDVARATLKEIENKIEYLKELLGG